MKQIVLGFRQRLFLIALSMASLTIFFGCIYWYSWYSCEPTIKDVSRVGFYVFAAIMTAQWGPFWIRNLIKAWKSKPSSNNTQWFEDPVFNNDLAELAQRMSIKLNKNEQLGIIKDFGDARLTSKKQLLVGDKLWDVLTNQERLALAAHEFAHSKKRHQDRFRVLSVVAVVITFVVTRIAPLDVQTIFPLASFFIASLIVSYRNEYDADLVAVKFSDRESVMSLLRKLKLPDRWSLQTLSHPSVNNRIQKILKLNSARANAHLGRDL